MKRTHYSKKKYVFNTVKHRYKAIFLLGDVFISVQSIICRIICEIMKYSVILPTYNEKENLPLMISMINRSFENLLVTPPSFAQSLIHFYSIQRIAIIERSIMRLSS